MSLEYRQSASHFTFDALRCLRTDYARNDCRECIEICPTEAFGFDRGRMVFKNEACIGCGVCVGVCPTEALSVEFFDPAAYAASLEGEATLSCKKDVPCLSLFDTPHFAAMLLGCEEVRVDLSHCAECPLDPRGRTSESIRKRMAEAERFVAALGLERRFKEESFQSDRRRFFQALAQKLTNDETPARQETSTPKSRYPAKLDLLKSRIRSLAPKLPRREIDAGFSFLSDKTIDEMACDNCGECIKFCPTEALFWAKEGTAIWFVPGRCIACGICSDVCEPNAVGQKDVIDIVAWAFDRGKELVEHTFEICSECKTPFAYKGGDPICGRCREFVDRFGDIFKIAGDE